MIPPNRKAFEPRFSLSFLVSLWTALSIAAALIVYALIQYLLLPEMSAREFFIHHLWHVFVLGALIHLSCWCVFRVLLFRPLNRVYLHLYSLGAGDIRELDLKSSVKEIAMIVEGINVMTWRLHHWLDADALAETKEQLEQIGLLAAQLRMENEDVSQALMDRVESLEETLFAVVAARDNGNGEPQNIQESWE